MNMVRFNSQTIIDHLEYIDEIYIVCQSEKTSKFIKNKYFKHIPRIKVNKNLQFSKLKHGYNIVSINKDKTIPINIIGTNSFNFYSIMRITQTIVGTIMFLCSTIIYLKLRQMNNINRIPLTIKIPLIILFLFGIMAIINGLTSTCTMSIILKNYLN